MMTEPKNTITVHVNIEIAPGSIKAVVENAKKLAGRTEKGTYNVDTADKLSEMISKFLREKDFEAYAQNIDNY